MNEWPHPSSSVHTTYTTPWNTSKKSTTHQRWTKILSYWLLLSFVRLFIHSMTCSFSLQRTSWKPIIFVLVLLDLFRSRILITSFLPPSLLRFLSHSSLFNWNQTYYNEVIWLFSCFKASPRCRAPSSPIWLSRKLHFVFEK